MIDAIGSKLLPKITESVKEIVSSNVPNGQQDRVNDQVTNAVSDAKKQLITALQTEIENISNINDLHSITRRMAISVGALKVLADRGLVGSLSDASSIKKQISMLFVENLNDILEDRTKIDQVKINSISAELRNNLKTATNRIDDALGRLKTTLSFAGGPYTFDTEKVNNFIQAIERSAPQISDIVTEVDSTSRLIESYLEAYLLSFKKLKEEIEKK